MGKKLDAMQAERDHALKRLAVVDNVCAILQKPMGSSEFVVRIALDHFWTALKAEHQTAACIALRTLQAEHHAFRKALMLAVDLLAPLEPGDSRAVSNEFVALAAVSIGDISPEVMAVIDEAAKSIGACGVCQGYGQFDQDNGDYVCPKCKGSGDAVVAS